MLITKRRGRYAAALTGACAVVGSLALAAPAFATSAAANNTIVGSGSATTYQVMTSLGDLFNGMSGCNMIVAAGDPQPLNYSCQAPANPKTASYAENPLNDVAVEEPALGSSNGITQLENQANPSPSVPTAASNFARSSRAIKSPGDDAGLNFVAYAKDGVSWFHFSEVDGAVTASSKVASLTIAQLQAIALGHSKGGDDNWDQVGGTNAPILLFAAQAGSGTESTWESAISANWPLTAVAESDKGTTDHVVFENEDRQIIAVTSTNPKAANYIGNIIFLFSYGKYNVTCATAPKVCGGTPVPGTTSAKPTKAVLGAINGVAPSPATILCTTVGPTCPKGPFPVPRFIYNVYANSHSGSDSTKLVPATPATLNFVSEAGFICKLNAGVLDPTTGVSVRAEITDAISGNGFIPLPEVSNEDSGVNFPATFATGSPYKQFDNAPNSKGYCITTSTG
jgi:ABC-type phosphate transport system substrate-binding protein